MNIIYINNFKVNFNELLGNGTFSNVYKCTDLSNNNYAVKIVEVKKKKNKDMIMNEIQVLKLLKSHYIINLIDFMEKDNSFYLFLELADLKFTDIIQEMLINDIFKYLKQLLKALIYIQNFNIVHNDIKPANILIKIINNEHVLKICDFGMSADINNNHNFFCGSPIFMNIDRLKGNYKSNSDFWAIKLIYYYMVYGKHPFEGATNIKQLINLINKGVKFIYRVNIHTDILQDLFNNNPIINTPNELLTKIELIEYNFYDNTNPSENITIKREPYKDYSIYINISSMYDSNYYYNDDDFYQKLVDGEFEEYILLE